MIMLSSTNVEIFVWIKDTAVIVEEKIGITLTRERRNIVVLHQALSVPQIERITRGDTMLPARQENCYPGTSHVIIITVMAVQY